MTGVESGGREEGESIHARSYKGEGGLDKGEKGSKRPRSECMFGGRERKGMEEEVNE